MSVHVEKLRAKLESRAARIGVCGLGYVGLPLARAIASAGLTVVGFDIDETKTAAINSGRSYIGHIPSDTVAALVDSGRLVATAEFELISEIDVVAICVPTPLTAHQEPDLSFVIKTAQAIAKHARPGQLIVLESTTYPGTTVEVLKPIFDARGLASGRDVFLAFSPEREDPANSDFTTTTIPKVVGGDGKDASELATAFYGSFIKTVVPVSSAATAEAVKLTENIFRAVNIALVNELKTVYSAMGIDIWEVIEAAKTKPFGFMPFYPGPGLGGHCVPIDPFYLAWKAREYGVATRFVELAGEINVSMPGYVVQKLVEALDRHQSCGLNGTKVLILGVAYKRNVDDTRESPALSLWELLEARGAIVDYHDPHVPEVPPTRRHGLIEGRRSVALDPAAVRNYNVVLIATDHDAVDYPSVVRAARLVVDTRNVCERSGANGPNVVKA